MTEKKETMATTQDLVVHYDGEWTDADRQTVDRAIRAVEGAREEADRSTWFCYGGRAGETSLFVARSTASPDVLLTESAEALAAAVEESRAASSQTAARASGDAAASPHPPSSPVRTKILFVDFRSEEAVEHHPEIAPWLQQGWHLKSAAPRIVEGAGTKLLVVLTRAEDTLEGAEA